METLVKDPTREQVIENLQLKAKRKRSMKLGSTEVERDVQCYPKAVIARFFPDTKAAIRAAGLYPVHPDDEDLLRALKEFYEEYGVSPHQDDEMLPYRHTTYASHFGTPNKALKAAGLPIWPPVRKFTDEERARLTAEMIAAAQKLAGEKKILPSQSEFRRVSGCPDSRVKLCVGSYQRLAELAGLQVERQVAKDDKIVRDTL